VCIAAATACHCCLQLLLAIPACHCYLQQLLLLLLLLGCCLPSMQLQLQLAHRDVLTAQNLQPRVQVSPMSMMVAVAVWPSPPPALPYVGTAGLFTNRV